MKEDDGDSIRGYRVIKHDRGHECPGCKRKTYCKDCQVCEKCGWEPAHEIN